MRARSAVLAVPLLLGPGALALFSGGYFGVARLVAAIAAWVLLAAAAVVAPDPLPRSRAAWAALAGLALLTGWAALSLTWAPLGEPAGEDVQRDLVYLPALAAGVVVLRDQAAARAAEPLLLAGIAGAIAYGLSDRLLPGVIELETIASAGDRLAQPLTYWNATGALAAIGLVLAAALAGDAERPRALRAAAAATAPLLGLAVYLTFSRVALGTFAAGAAVLLALAPTRAQVRAAALVAGAAAVPAVATLALPAVARAGSDAGQGAAMLALLVLATAGAAAIQARTERSGGAIPRVRALAVAGMAVALVATAVAVAGIERGDSRDGAARLASVQSNRYAYWKVAVETFADHPLRGIGAGGFRVAWLRERPFRESVRDAHSLYLETAAELGLAGLAALALLFGGVAAGARRALRAGPALAGPVAALAAWALHAGVDWDWEMPALTLVAVVLAARVLATSPEASAPAGGRAP